MIEVTQPVWILNVRLQRGVTHLLCATCQLKKKCTASKSRVMFYLVDKTEALSPEHGISDNSERQFRKGKWGAKIYRSFCNKDQVDGTF